MFMKRNGLVFLIFVLMIFITLIDVNKTIASNRSRVVKIDDYIQDNGMSSIGSNAVCDDETYCRNNHDLKEGTYITLETPVKLEVREDTLTRTGATVVITNKSENDTYEYGYPYHLEVMNNNKWYELETINDLAFILPAFELLPGDSEELNINWNYAYGKLEDGTYRIVKDITKGSSEPTDPVIYIVAEFTIGNK